MCPLLSFELSQLPLLRRFGQNNFSVDFVLRGSLFCFELFCKELHLLTEFLNSNILDIDALLLSLRRPYSVLAR
jgi:hypothetical protein